MSEAVSFPEAGDLGFAVGRHDDGGVHSFVDTGFEQQRYVVNYHGGWICSSSLSRQSGLLAGDAGMDDSFKPPPLGSTSENNGSQLTAIDGVVGIEDGVTEYSHDLSPSRFARLDDFMGQFVGVDDDCAALLKHLGDGALAGRDAPCESNQNHGGGA